MTGKDKLVPKDQEKQREIGKWRLFEKTNNRFGPVRLIPHGCGCRPYILWPLARRVLQIQVMWAADISHFVKMGAIGTYCLCLDEKMNPGIATKMKAKARKMVGEYTEDMLMFEHQQNNFVNKKGEEGGENEP